MFRRVFLARLLLAALFGALLVPAQAQEKFSEPALSDPDSWTVVLLPDLQGYAKKACNQPIMEIMTSWIAAHAEALNTKLVLCVGDLVEQNDRISNGYSGDQSSHKQWEATARAFSQLDGVVPYMTATGNHDYTYTRTGDRRTHIGEYFPVDKNPLNRRMLSQYGLDAQGNHAVENAAFELRSPEGIDYLFLNLEFAPRDTVIGWARRIVGLEEYRNHRVVLMTHSYLNAESERIAGDPVRVTSYEPVVKNGKITKFKQELPDANQGEAIWRKLVYPASNIELVLCGHVSGWGFRTDANSAGRPVHQMLFDSQSMGGGYEGNGGDGWIRILEFLPDGRTVLVRFFFADDFSNDFFREHGARDDLFAPVRPLAHDAAARLAHGRGQPVHLRVPVAVTAEGISSTAHPGTDRAVSSPLPARSLAVVENIGHIRIGPRDERINARQQRLRAGRKAVLHPRRNFGINLPREVTVLFERAQRHAQHLL